MSVLEYVKSDLYRYRGQVSVGNFVREYMFNKAFNVQVWFRLMSVKGPIGFVAKVISYIKQRQTGIYLGLKTNIGHGLYIGHAGPIIINSGTTIGSNVNLSQYTSIGSNSDAYATIGDNVYIGPNVSVVEGVTIGNNVTVGAGSVVVKDLEENATAAGNYAKVLNYNNAGRYINNVWS
ncbi:serine acetyltransferase [Weissella cibaria]|nr:serine acetyltransferase [Weissella cibaria]